METYFYFSVKTVCCGYLFYRLWIFLFRQRIYGLWEDMAKYLPKKKEKPTEPVTASKDDDNEVIGKTNIVYLEDPEIACKVPARSEPLPPAEEMEEEEDIAADDVESTFTGNPPGGLSEEEKAELMSDYVSEVDEDFSTGMTYEDMMNAVGVLTEENRNTNDEKVIRTVKSIYDIRQTEIFDFFTTEVSNIELVESLFKECLDEYGEPLPQRKKEAPPESEEKFDWDKFV